MHATAGTFFLKGSLQIKFNRMENQVIHLSLFRTCADTCKLFIAHLKKNPEMEVLIRLCRICAARCEQVIMYETDSSVYEKCGEACKACKEECSKYLDEYSRKCADACKKCEEECLQNVE
jgi:hypothetical protein